MLYLEKKFLNEKKKKCIFWLGADRQKNLISAEIILYITKILLKTIIGIKIINRFELDIAQIIVCNFNFSLEGVEMIF